jgi:60 kDa SS-A/Ro ribonucleoprotein
MTTNYAGILSTKATPQTEAIPGSNQQLNNAGGYTFVVDMWTRLDRFLILGAEGGSYYVGERQLVKENALEVIKAIQTDGERVVRRIVEISLAGRAPKNDPAIFALALAATYGNDKTKAAAYIAIKSVCRTGAHIFMFCDQVNQLRGWSRGLRTGVSRFYTERNPNQLALQLIKYRQRNGFTHRDVLRLAHPSTKSAEHKALFQYTVARDAGKEYEAPSNSIVVAFEAAQKATNASDLIKCVKAADLPWEAIPTEFLKDVKVWEALLPSMGITAMLRNLGRMSSLDLFKGGRLNQNTQVVVNVFTNRDMIRESRLHPISILIGLTTYSSGHGFKGGLSWSVEPAIVDALDKAFYFSFGNVESTGKSFLLGLDVSGSMDSKIANTNLSHREAVAAMALVTASVEQKCGIMGFSDKFINLQISPGMRLDQVVKYMRSLPFSRTDCSLPIEFALQHGFLVDVFVVYTDNETYVGRRHPSQALTEYRKRFNPNAKMIVVATESSRSTIADPNYAGMLDIVGFDASVPNLITEFVR